MYKLIENINLVSFIHIQFSRFIYMFTYNCSSFILTAIPYSHGSPSFVSRVNKLCIVQFFFSCIILNVSFFFSFVTQLLYGISPFFVSLSSFKSNPHETDISNCVFSTFFLPCCDLLGFLFNIFTFSMTIFSS